ncbi:hypothetical protein LMTR13_12340 [Bradyrhizobium icense]|uniref:Uncharacterized protein n=1 Tax=Bradyrhizobium icense TaxID=1274631 RepID=A0A1B1UDK6_9BRAD|nr:hypothetical protein LMTR13_12340 [Bradyrhizobium icense]
MFDEIDECRNADEGKWNGRAKMRNKCIVVLGPNATQDDEISFVLIARDTGKSRGQRADQAAGKPALELVLYKLNGRNRPFSGVPADRNAQAVQFEEESVDRSCFSIAEHNRLPDQFGLSLCVLYQDRVSAFLDEWHFHIH